MIVKVVTGAYQDLYLTNTTLSGNYEAVNSITAENNVTVTGTATLKAGNNIHLKPGFHAHNGSNFNAKIGTVSTDLERYYYIKDHLGSIRVTSDESGTVVSAQDYFAYGELLREHNSAERYKYTEKERDTETEYDYFGARYYDSELGRWLNVDPMADLSSLISPYVYCFNNPLNYTDPDGMWPWDDPNYIWDDELGMWRLRSIDELWAVTGWEKLSSFSAEESSFLATFGAIAVAEPTIGGEIIWGIAAGGLIGAKILDIIFSSDDDTRLLMSEETKSDESKVKEEKISVNQAQEKVRKDQAPISIKRVDKGKAYKEQDNIHFKDGSALNRDGSWKHGQRRLTNAEKEFLKEIGWTIPKGQ